jgi:transposase InsO family protein
LNFDVQEEIRVANGESLRALGKGNIDLIVEADNGVKIKVTIYDVLYVPEAKGKLLSVHKLIEKDYKVIFNQNIVILVHGKRQYRIGYLRNGLYMMNEYHIKGKMYREPFPKKSINPAKERLDVIVSDVCGPMQTNSIGNKKYFVTFIDEYTRYSHVYFLLAKSDVNDHLVQFIEMLKNKFGRKPKVFRSDNGLEYVNSKVQGYLKREGIQIQQTVPYSSQQNGIAERKNRTLMDAARSMLFKADLDKSYWAEAVSCANYIQNRLITRATGKTPIEMWNDELPQEESYHEFGADCYAWIPNVKRKKLDQRAQKLKFMGYDETSKGYKLINPETKVISIARDVKVLESRKKISTSDSTRDEEIVVIDMDETKVIDNKDQLIDNEDQLNDLPDVDVNNLEHDNNNNTVSDLDDNESSYYESEVSIYETDHGDMFDEDFINESLPQNVIDPDATIRRSTRQNIGNTSKYDDYICKIEKAEIKEPRTYDEAIICVDSVSHFHRPKPNRLINGRMSRTEMDNKEDNEADLLTKPLGPRKDRRQT